MDLQAESQQRQQVYQQDRESSESRPLDGAGGFVRLLFLGDLLMRQPRSEGEGGDADKVRAKPLIEKRSASRVWIDDHQRHEPQQQADQRQRAQKFGSDAARGPEQGRPLSQPADGERAAVSFEWNGDGKENDGGGQVQVSQRRRG